MNYNPMKTLSKTLKSLREQNNLTQRELANLSGCSNAEISRIESGIRFNPSPLILRELAIHLKVSYIELMKTAGYLTNDDLEEYYLLWS